MLKPVRKSNLCANVGNRYSLDNGPRRLIRIGICFFCAKTTLEFQFAVHQRQCAYELLAVNGVAGKAALSHYKYDV